MPRCQFQEMQHQIIPTEQESFFCLFRSECSKPEQLVVTFAAGYIGKFPLINQQHVAKVNCNGQNTSPCVEGGHVWLAFFNALNLESI